MFSCFLKSFLIRTNTYSMQWLRYVSLRILYLKKILKVYNIKIKTSTYLRNAVLFPNVKLCRSCLNRFKTLLNICLCISDSTEDEHF